MSRWFGLLLGLGLTVRLALAWLPVETLTVHTIPDDGFIYFVIARNLAAGLGATFDGLQPTNGFHPLWAILIMPVFWLAGKGDLPVHLALTLGAVCDVLAGGLTAYGIWRITQNQLATVLTLALYLFNPRLVQESVNGLETGLGLLCLAGCLFVALKWWETPERKGRAVLFGVMAGLVLLARSDLAIVVALWFAAFAIQNRGHSDSWLTAGVAAGITIAPWFIWSQIRIGTPIQSSGVAIPSLVAARIQASSDVALIWDQLLFPIINFSFRNAIIYPGIALLASIMGLALARWPNRARFGSPVAIPKLPVIVWLPLIGALMIVGVHTFIRWYPRGWYFTPLAWAGALIGGPLLAAGLAAPAGRRFGRVILALLGLVVLGQSIKMIGEPDYQNQRDMRIGAEWLRNRTEPDALIGAFNAGIYSYYSERRVLSLDGLVDWGAIEARQENRLLDYFVDRGGDLIIDHQAYLDSFRPFFGPRTLTEESRLPVLDPTYGPIVLYQVAQ